MVSTIRAWSRPIAVADEVSPLSDDAVVSARALFERRQRDVNRLVYQLMGPDGDHDDIVQDIFLRIVARVGTLRDPEREHAWVTTVAVRVVRNHLRRRKVRRIVELHATPPEPIDAVEPRLVARDLVRRGYRLLDELAAVDRIVLILRRVRGCSIDETAALCRCSRATVKRRLQRAEAQLSNRLSADPELYEHLAGGGER